MKLEQMPIEELNAADYNPRVDLQPGDRVYESLKRSVETFGYLQPIIVNRRNNTVVGGHQRLKVLRDLGYAESTERGVDDHRGEADRGGRADEARRRVGAWGWQTDRSGFRVR